MEELKGALAGNLVVLKDFRASDVGGHEVRSELNAAKAEVHRVGQGADHESLGQAGDANQETMSARENSDDQLFEDALLADNGLIQLFLDAAVAIVEPLDGREIAFQARPVLGFGHSRGDLGDFRDGDRLVARKPGAAAA